MTLKFYNSNTLADGYDGLPFSTCQEGLELIRDSLIGAGWFVELDDIDPNFNLQMKGFDEDQDFNKNTCFFKFYKNANDNIAMVGYLGNDNNELSPEFEFKITKNQQNKLWLTCDSGAGALMILNGSLSQPLKQDETCNDLKAVHFGFCKRLLFSDTYGWYIGTINYDMSESYAAKLYASGDIWWKLSDSYERYNVYYSFGDYDHQLQYRSRPAQGNYDRTVALQEGWIGIDHGRSHNAAFKCYNGALNGVTMQPWVDSYYYIEGYNSDSAYGNYYANQPRELFIRGLIKYVCTGVASLKSLELIVDSENKRWLSTNNLGWQGMLIDQP